MQILSTGEAIVNSLIKHDVDTVFGVPGAHTYHLCDALARQNSQINFVTARHEQGAGHMAFGFAKSTGRPGIYTVVPGPGVLNSSSSLAIAYATNSPVLCLTGNIMSHLIGRGRGQLHELPDQLATIRSITKWVERINHPSEAPEIVSEAFRQMMSGRRGPVSIEAPWDIFGIKAPVDLDVKTNIKPTPEPDPDHIANAAEIILNAKNPMIVVGAGAQDASQSVQRLAELIQAPVTAHRSGKGVLTDAHELSLMSVAAYEYWPKCDCIIGIGSRLELIHFKWRAEPTVKTVRIDIDPTEMPRIPADAKIIADATAGTDALIVELERSVSKRVSRVDEFNGYRRVAQEKIDKIQPQAGYLRAIRNVLPKDGILVEEVTQVAFTARYGFPVYGPRKFITSGYQDSLGFGFQTSVGVKVANPDTSVVSISGDGGFMFGVQELATAVQHQLNIVAIVFNNNSFGNVRRDQINNFDGRLIGSDLINPDFVALAESFGAKGVRCKSPMELQTSLEEAFKEPGPVLIEVPVERGTETSPWPLSHPVGTEVSKPAPASE